jgi:hypothetical protein
MIVLVDPTQVRKCMHNVRNIGSAPDTIVNPRQKVLDHEPHKTIPRAVTHARQSQPQDAHVSSVELRDLSRTCHLQRSQ